MFLLYMKNVECVLQKFKHKNAKIKNVIVYKNVNHAF